MRAVARSWRAFRTLDSAHWEVGYDCVVSVDGLRGLLRACDHLDLTLRQCLLEIVHGDRSTVMWMDSPLRLGVQISRRFAKSSMDQMMHGKALRSSDGGGHCLMAAQVLLPRGKGDRIFDSGV